MGEQEKLEAYNRAERQKLETETLVGELEELAGDLMVEVDEQEADEPNDSAYTADLLRRAWLEIKRLLKLLMCTSCYEKEQEADRETELLAWYTGRALQGLLAGGAHDKYTSEAIVAASNRYAYLMLEADKAKAGGK